MKKWNRLLDKYLHSFAVLYKAINYHDAYKIISKFHPDLSMEEFVNFLNDRTKKWSLVRVYLEQENEYWIYDWFGDFICGGDDKYPNNRLNNIYGSMPIKVLEAIDYEKKYCGYIKDTISKEGQILLDYLKQNNPGITNQRFQTWRRYVLGERDKVFPVKEIIESLKGSKCFIPDEQYLSKLVQDNNNSIRLSKYRGRNYKEYVNKDFTNCIKPAGTLSKRHKLGYSTIYQFANAAIRLYQSIDAFKLCEIIEKYYPDYDVKTEMLEAIKSAEKNDFLLGFKKFKIIKVRQDDSYCQNNKWIYNYIFCSELEKHNKDMVDVAYSINKAKSLYTTPTIDEYLDWGSIHKSYNFNEYNKELSKYLFKFYGTSEWPRFLEKLKFNIIKQEFKLDNFLLALRQIISLSAMDDNEFDQLAKLISDYYWNIRLSWLCGYNRLEAKKLGIKPLPHRANFLKF